MNAQEIRKRINVPDHIALMEIAAQLAEANENLEKIANPLMTVSRSPWVKLKNWKGMSVVINRDEVVAVIEWPVDVTQSNYINSCLIVLKSGYQESAIGTGEQVCQKLGIPYGG